MIQGNDKIVTVTFIARGDTAPSDPTAVTFTVKDPSKVTTTYTYDAGQTGAYDVLRVSAGVFELRVACALAGIYYVTGHGTGNVKASAGVTIKVDADASL